MIAVMIGCARDIPQPISVKLCLNVGKSNFKLEVANNKIFVKLNDLNPTGRFKQNLS